ncbi:MAG: hypothetical protein R3D59_09340 [Paracoccaceae bacterium]
MSTLRPDQSVVFVCLFIGIVGLGLGSVLQLVVVMGQNAVPLADVGTATSVNNFFREIGATLGIAVVGQDVHRASQPHWQRSISAVLRRMR